MSRAARLLPLGALVSLFSFHALVGAPWNFGVIVEPHGGIEPGRPANTSGYTTTFEVINTGTTSVTYGFECWGTGGISCASVQPTSLKIAGGHSANITVTYDVGASGGSIYASAEGGGGYDEGYKSVAIVPPPTITITAPQLTTDTTALVYSRLPQLQATMTGAELDSTSLVVTLGSDTITGLVRRNLNILEWEVDSSRELSAGVLRRFAVRACTIGGACTTAARYLKLDDSGKPWVSFGGMPFEAQGRVAVTPLGPGIAASGPEVEAAFGVPAHMVFSAPQSTGLVYSTRQSHPRALVNADIELTWPAGTPSQLKARLLEGARVLDSLVVSSPSCSAAGGRRCRVALQGDYADSAFTRARRKWLRVEVSVTSGGVTKTTTDSVEVVLVDRRRSPYGSGWAVAGVTRLDSAGTDMILVSPTGAATIFRGYNGRYLAPPGDYGQLQWDVGQWLLRPRGAGPYARAVFNAGGSLTQLWDRNNNVSRVTYAAGTERVDSLVDPSGQAFRFTYIDSTRVTITDPTNRQSFATIDAAHRLVFDSTASPASRRALQRFGYTSSGANGAVVLTTRVGPASDTTSVSYSARQRPSQVSLPRVLPETGTTLIRPVIAYTAQETRALGTLRSSDSVYLSVTGPLGAWMHSALNRWGAPTLSWDTLGTLARASYLPDGQVAWSQGRDDSTRVYHTYDTLGRRVRSYRLTSQMIRLDSVVYDANYWVVKRFGPLGPGDITLYAYDGRGNVTGTTDPLGRTSSTWYGTTGVVDSARGPGDTAAVRYSYDFARNLYRIRDGDTITTVLNVLDGAGRVEMALRRGPTRYAGDTLYISWMRDVVTYAVDNLVDVATAERSRDCRANVCGPDWESAQWPSGAADSLYQAVAQHYRDAWGRDTLVTDQYGRGGRVVYDGLGRTRALYPFRDSSGIVDSMRYDLAGRLRYHRTRRGTVIEHRYDSRGRDTLTIVPGVGDYARSYAGPNDELSALTVANYVDSIGGVNPSLSWSYGHAGQLTSATTQGNRVTTFVHDRLLRDSVVTDPTGTALIRYDSLRGYVNWLVTPFADTLTYVLDYQDRVIGPWIAAAGSGFYRQAKYSNAGRLISLRNGDTPSPGQLSLGTLPSGQALGYRWTEQQGGGPFVQRRDSFNLDGWSRVWRGRYYTGPDTALTLQRTDTFAFDGRGNLLVPGETRTYHALTNRLLVQGGDTLRYDRAGNLVERKVAGGASWTYGYDALDRLVAVRYGATLIARYGYDALGRRIARRVYAAGPKGATTGYVRLLYGGQQALAEADSGGTLTRAYTWDRGADNLIAVHRYAGNLHAHVIQDAVHSVRGMVLRAAGGPLWQVSWRYAAYGAAFDSAGTDSVGVRYRWAGALLDPETGFYYLRARYYDPAAQRFTQDDPSHAVGDYGYAGGNPIDGRDPFGTVKLYDEWAVYPGSRPWDGRDPLQYVDAILAYVNALQQFSVSYGTYSTLAQGIIDANPLFAGQRPLSPFEFERARRALFWSGPEMFRSNRIFWFEVAAAEGIYLVDVTGFGGTSFPGPFTGRYDPEFGVIWINDAALHSSVFDDVYFAAVLVHESLHPMVYAALGTSITSHCAIAVITNTFVGPWTQQRPAPVPFGCESYKTREWGY